MTQILGQPCEFQVMRARLGASSHEQGHERIRTVVHAFRTLLRTRAGDVVRTRYPPLVRVRVPRAVRQKAGHEGELDNRPCARLPDPIPQLVDIRPAAPRSAPGSGARSRGQGHEQGHEGKVASKATHGAPIVRPVANHHADVIIQQPMLPHPAEAELVGRALQRRLPSHRR